MDITNELYGLRNLSFFLKLYSICVWALGDNHFEKDIRIHTLSIIVEENFVNITASYKFQVNAMSLQLLVLILSRGELIKKFGLLQLPDDCTYFVCQKKALEDGSCLNKSKMYMGKASYIILISIFCVEKTVLILLTIHSRKLRQIHQYTQKISSDRLPSILQGICYD